jgi:hypothetical protein
MRTEFFTKGLKAAGYEIGTNYSKPEKNDVLLVWNTNHINKPIRAHFTNAGARVVVAENGYIGTDDNGRRLVSLALNGHAGKGQWNVGAEKRHLKHNFEIKPWRQNGENIVVLAQRGIGEAKDLDWAEETARQIRGFTGKPVIVRAHPGKKEQAIKNPLEPFLNEAYCCATWSSGAGIKAIAYGVPVMYFMEGWIGGYAASYGLSLDRLYRSDREILFHKIGWAQWTIDEIESGQAFKVLLC